jgi:DNA-binding MarR family transcriptional regulator
MDESRMMRGAAEGATLSEPANERGEAPADEHATLDVTRTEVISVSELLVRLVLLSRTADRSSAPAMQPSVGLTPHAVQATLHLFQHRQRTVGELADGLKVSIGWASRIADELERSGHVVRERDPLDRRIVHLRLSPPATRLAEQMYRARGRAVAHALRDLDATQRAAVTQFLARLIEEMEHLSEPGR